MMSRTAVSYRSPVFVVLSLLLLAGCGSTESLGTGLSQPDREKMSAVTQSTLESTRTGESVNWRGKDGDVVGTVTPVRTFTSSSGTPCREFQRSLTVGGKTEVRFGTACRKPDGVWIIKSSRYAYRDGRYPDDHYHDPYWDYPYGYHGYGHRYGPGFRFGYGHRHHW